MLGPRRRMKLGLAMPQGKMKAHAKNTVVKVKPPKPPWMHKVKICIAKCYSDFNRKMCS